MQQLNNLSDAADQVMTIILADGSLAQVEFIYRPTIERWTVDILHENLEVRGLNVCQSPNLLRQWKNLISFGMAVLSVNGNDPSFPTDFADENVTINILDSGEVRQVESEILNA